MAYASWSVVFGEQPSAAKWNILGTNDASFNDGTGISALTVGATTAVRNSYKFSAYRSTAQNSGNSAFAIVNFNTELYDTGNNFDTVTNVGRFTAPIAGFYHFDARVGTTQASGGNRLLCTLYKNGSEVSRGSDGSGAGGTLFFNGSQVSDTLSLAINDYVEVYSFGSAALALEVTQPNTRFSGYLVSST